MFKKVISFLLFISFVSTSYASKNSSYSSKKIHLKKWEVVHIEFKSTATKNPFEVKFEAIFLQPNGKELIVPGFYNGNNTYVIRFSGNQTGDWSYTTNSDIKRLHNKKGHLHISSEAFNNCHGGIIIDKENPQYVSYEDEHPYFMTAYEFDWFFALDYGKKEQTETVQILDKIAENGFNQMVMNVYAYDIRWKKDPKIIPAHEYGKPNFFPFLGSNTDPDFSSLNVDFFKNLDKKIELLHEKNIVSHLMIYVWNKEVNWPAMNSLEDNRYFDYIIKRYQAYPNIIWDVSKEALAYGRCDEPYLKERISRVRKLDAYKRLLTVHDFKFCRKNSELVDFISIQNWNTELYHVMTKCRADFPNKPIFNIEHGGYEKSPYEVFIGSYDDPKTCLRRNYVCAFAGTYSTYYWQANSWSVIITDIDALPKEQQPKLNYYNHFINFFQKHEFKKFKPSNASVSWNLTDGNGKYIMFHPSENNSVRIHVPKPANGHLNLTWFNPHTGNYSKTAPLKWASYLWAYPPKLGQDWILLAE
ncbi:DUF5060 domain-containing protein [Flavicella sediminum]|uniref:DUF5060 domain-containing protein n=1 Tax=Flavicella sediminum TaxID=2585141 RepID=UPI00111E3977|nr:DUF5060 domain-containing protein [Flavicella sediminum]